MNIPEEIPGYFYARNVLLCKLGLYFYRLRIYNINMKGGVLVDIIKTIKKAMVDKGRDDFVTYLSEILGITKQWASSKMSGKSPFNVKELSKIAKELDVTFDFREV